jgi:hypothetical protein
MYEKELYKTLISDAVLVSLLSTYRLSASATKPAIFDDSAPEGAEFPYVVYRIEQYPVDGAVSRFEVVLDYFGHSSVASRTKARQAIDRIILLLKYQEIDTARFGEVTHFEPLVLPIPEPDSRGIHYNIRCEASGVEKQWLESLT